MNFDEEITRELSQLALVLLVHDLNWSGLMKLPVPNRVALAASGGLSPDQLIAATEQLHRINLARREEELRRMPPGDEGAH